MARQSKKEQESEDLKLLKKYMGQYYRSRIRKKQLETRLREICAEMTTPADREPDRPANQTGSETASLAYRKSEYETRIQGQKEAAEKALLKVMDILDFLEPNNDERMVLELRYIDNKSWEGVARAACMSRSVCFEKHKAGLEKLLTYKRVKAVLKKYKEESRAY